MPAGVNRRRTSSILSGMTEREFAIEVVSRLQREGHQALFAGGCVRDELLGLTPADHDVATSATPDQVKALFRRTHSFGASFGVVEVLGPRDAQGEWLKVQVATFRSDGTYTDGRRPDSVTFSSPEEDAARRDFTINGMFFDPIAGRVIDYVGGDKDLRNKVLRAIGDPVARFTEDKLRILRAVRMAARFELEIEPYTLAAMGRMVDQVGVVSAERIAEELRKILKHPTRGQGVWLLVSLGLHKVIIPEVVYCVSRPGYQALPPDASFELGFALMLRGVKTATVTAVCRRLRLSNPETERIVWLCKNREALTNPRSMPRSYLFPLLAHPGIHELVWLHAAEDSDPGLELLHTAEGRNPSWVEYVRQLLRDNPPQTFDPPRLLTGDDLKAMGLKPGPQFKAILDEVRNLQLDGVLKTRSEAEEKVRLAVGH